MGSTTRRPIQLLPYASDLYGESCGRVTPAAAQDDQLVDAVLGASRALVAVAARSLGDLAEDVTLAQYRVLVELAARGPQRVAELAGVLGVERSTATRMCDRLVRKRLIHRRRESRDRRAVQVALTGGGRSLVDRVTRRRREEISRILERLAPRDRAAVRRALRAFADAAGTVPEQDWSLGWNLAPEESEAAARGEVR
jgi:DNA-binding MarR family transcriptional regulator